MNASSDDPKGQAVYYVMTNLIDTKTARLSKQPWAELPRRFRSWTNGKAIPPDVAVPQPLQFEIEPDDEGDMPAFFRSAIPLMTDELVAILKRVGVDNLQVHDAQITELGSGRVHRNYKGVNVIGVVSAADPANSVIEPLLEDSPQGASWITKLTIDPAHAGGMLMFRLADSLDVLLVHRTIKEAVEAKSLSRVSFVHPADHSG